MNTEKNMNVIEMIDAFEVYEARGIFDDYDRNDKFLRFLLDRSKVPSYRSYKKIVVSQKAVGGKGATKDVVQNKRLTLDELTPEQLTELQEVDTLMNAGYYQRTKKNEKMYAEYADHDNVPEQLRALIMKFPPVLQEQVLIVAIVIYVLRHLDADFDSDSNSFTEFYHNYSDIVVGTFCVS